MDTNKMMYWHNGLFLKPHHFQYMQIYIQNAIKQLNNLTMNYNWGLIDLEINEMKLNGYELDLSKGIFFFKDGTIVDFPKNAIVNSRNFAQIIKNRTSLKCYIGIKKLNNYDSNVTELDGKYSGERINTRFVFNKEKSVLTNNLYESNDKVDMLYLDHYLKLFFEDEIDTISDYELLPIAMIENIEGSIKLSKKYIAPSINISSNQNLENILDDIYKYLFSHVNKFEEYKTPYDYTSANLTVTKQLVALQAIAEFMPTLEAYISTYKIHPWEVYLTLSKLIAKLSAFTNRVNIKGKEQSGRVLLKEYNHNNIFNSFVMMKELIFNLLDDICVGPDKIINFKCEDDTYFVNIPREFFSDQYNFYISIEDKNIDHLLNNLQFMKISSRQKILEIITRSLPGLNFEKLEEPPIGVAKQRDTLYIKLDTNSKSWLDIKYTQDVALFLHDLDHNTKVQLVIIQK